MKSGKMWLVGIGGILAIIGQFWGMDYYLPLIGGVLALLSLLIK